MTVYSLDIVAPPHTAVLTFPAGNYSRTSLGEMMISLFNAAIAPAVLVITTSSPFDDGKYYFHVNGTANPPQFIFDTTSMWEQIGFDPGSTNVFDGGFNLVAPNVMNLQHEATLFIHSDICQAQNNILAAVYTQATPTYAYITYQVGDVQGFSLPLSSNNNNVYHFQLTSERGEAINLNGVNMLLTLFLYEPMETGDIIEAYTAMRAIETLRAEGEASKRHEDLNAKIMAIGDIITEALARLPHVPPDGADDEDDEDAGFSGENIEEDVPVGDDDVTGESNAEGEGVGETEAEAEAEPEDGDGITDTAPEDVTIPIG
jgi:hypothetical protein